VDRQPSSQVTTGAVLIVIGLVLLGGQLHIFDFWRMSRLWPLVLVALGAAQVAAQPQPGEGRRGVGLLMAGGILLLHTLAILRLNDSWPLFIVAFGVTMLFGRKTCASPRREGSHVP
jgi:hypothetical protein